MSIIDIFRKLPLPGLFLLALPFWVLVPAREARATHAAGAELTYKCLGGLTYEVYAIFYRDCGGTPEPSTLTIVYKSASCNYARTVIASKMVTGNGTEITLPCTTMPSSCNGGSSTGIVRWVYRAVVTLPFACNDWTFSYRVCCRNCTVTTIQSPCATGSELYVEAKLNNLDAPCNSSPIYGNSPIAFVCLGQNFNYNQGAFDPDGDSLSYELIAPKTSATGDVTFIPPATAASPIASSTPFTINPVTGDINFTPSMNQIAVMAIRVNEYRNGQWIGSTIRDMQIYTQICYNAIPYATGINGTNTFSATACVGQQLCFTIETFDNDTNQNVSVTWNNPIQGSVITQSGAQRPQLTFCWTPTIADISLIPKTFTILVKDNACPQNGMQSFSYSITVGSAAVSVITTDPLCFGSTGSAAAGGAVTQGYTYTWNTMPPHQGPSVAGLNPGSYTVVAVSPQGCSDTASFIIMDPPPAINVAAQSTGTVTCQSGNTGAAVVNVSGGTGGYQYQWSNGNTSPNVSGLSPGIYTVTVTDSIGCSVSDTVSIVVAGGLSLTLTQVTMVACRGDQTGSAVVLPSGGTPPYSYQWSNGTAASVIQQLAAGIYSVTVTDALQCTATAQVEITQPAVSMSSVLELVSAIKCYGESQGSLKVITTGGNLPYTYQWNHGATTSLVGSLTVGSYTVIIRDANGCSDSLSYSLDQPAKLILSGMVNHADCMKEPDGSVTVTPSGGTAPYAYEWSTGSGSSNMISSLGAGSYQCAVTDANGCSVSETFTVQNLSTPHLTVDTLHIICVGEMATLTVDSFPSSTYQWYFEGNLLNGATSNSFLTPAAGRYFVKVTNACGEFKSDTIRVDVKSIGNVTINNMQIICPPETASLYATGGVSYLWNPNSYITFTNIPDPVVSPPVTTTYTVEITNEFGCKTTLSTNIAVVCDSLLVPTGFSPNDDGVNDGYVIDGIENYPGNKLFVYNRYGRLVYKATDYANTWDGVSNVSGVFMNRKLPVGTYFYILDLNDRSKPRGGFIVLRR